MAIAGTWKYGGNRLSDFGSSETGLFGNYLITALAETSSPYRAYIGVTDITSGAYKVYAGPVTSSIKAARTLLWDAGDGYCHMIHYSGYSDYRDHVFDPSTGEIISTTLFPGSATRFLSGWWAQGDGVVYSVYVLAEKIAVWDGTSLSTKTITSLPSTSIPYMQGKYPNLWIVPSAGTKVVHVNLVTNVETLIPVVAGFTIIPTSASAEGASLWATVSGGGMLQRFDAATGSATVMPAAIGNHNNGFVVHSGKLYFPSGTSLVVTDGTTGATATEATTGLIPGRVFVTPASYVPMASAIVDGKLWLPTK